MAGLTRPELDRSVDHEPDDVSLVVFHLADQEASATRAGFPRDPFEWIARGMISQLPDFAGVPTPAPLGLGRQPSAPSPCRLPECREGTGQHLDPERVCEEKRHLVEALRAERCGANLKPETMNTPSSNASTSNGDFEKRSRSRSQVHLGRLHGRVEHARRDGGKLGHTHRLAAAVDELASEHERGIASRSVHVRVCRPDHFEAPLAQARDSDQRGGASDRNGHQHGAPERRDRREPAGGAQRNQTGRGDRHVESRPCGIEDQDRASRRRGPKRLACRADS